MTPAACRRADRPLVVAIVGADGAGKSTVAAMVRDRLVAARCPAHLVDRWDIVGNPHFPAAAFLAPDVRRVRSCTARMPATPRLLFLLWTSVVSLVDSRREQPQGEVLLLDGYWMKHAASEVAYGLDRVWVEQVVMGLPDVDVVLYLRSDPATTWRRKSGRALPYECAMDLSCSEDSFRHHQRKIHDLLDLWADHRGWVTVDATQPLELVVTAVVDVLAESGVRELDPGRRG